MTAKDLHLIDTYCRLSQICAVLGDWKGAVRYNNLADEIRRRSK